MNDKAFIDTNIFIYLYSEDEKLKQNISQRAVEKYDCTIVNIYSETNIKSRHF
jgi:predicted nucleic acid-binding protein